MSHTPTETIVCPNCGSIAEKNYCSECGQETHLHNDSFWGLVMHFIGHYFHYDSKFWKTLRALWFSPGKLTTAYWKKQRMRYIPPVSLYIFISAVFFLIFLLYTSNKDEIYSEFKKAKEDKAAMTVEQRKSDSLRRFAYYKSLGISPKTMDSNIAKKISPRIHKMRETFDEPEKTTEFVESLMHSVPKIFFFLIPLSAFFLKLLFFRRRELLFVHHAIFSLHVHSFCFSIFMFSFIPVIGDWINIAALLASALYLVIALKNAYSIKWIKAAFYSLLLFAGYALFAIIAFIVDFLILVLT